MSIASNVCETNTKLATARTLLREKLTANGIQYDNSDTIFELLKRWSYTNFAGYYFIFFPDDSVKEGMEISAGVSIYDNDDNGIEGVPAEVIINGTSYKVYSDSNGRAEKTFTAEMQVMNLKLLSLQVQVQKLIHIQSGQLMNSQMMESKTQTFMM